MTYAQSTPNVHVTGRRVVATLIDGIILGIVAGIVNALFGTKTTASGFDFTQLSTGGSFLLFVVVMVYYVLMEH
jgi:hypothetical protein